MPFNQDARMEIQKPENGNWEPFQCKSAEDKGYSVWIDRGLWTVYQITKNGEGKPKGESGYRLLNSLLKLKGIPEVTK